MLEGGLLGVESDAQLDLVRRNEVNGLLHGVRGAAALARVAAGLEVASRCLPRPAQGLLGRARARSDNPDRLLVADQEVDAVRGD